MSELPENVRQFLRDHISSVMHLEVLLRLRAAPDDHLTPMQLSSELGGSVDLAIACLAQLERSGLVRQVDDDLTYRYSPQDRARAAVVDTVADTYTRRKVAVVSEIFRQPDDPLRDFSNAFRLRRER